MLAKLSNHFLFLAISFLTLFSPFAIKAQNTAADCGEGYKYDYVYDQVFEPESETVYNPSNNANETRTVWKYKWKWLWKCVPIPPKANSTVSKDKKTSSSDSNAARNAEVKPSLGLRPPYAGQYSGKWITTYCDSTGQKGEWTLSVDADGKITGEEVNITFDVTGNISGFVSKDGRIELSIKYGGIFKDVPPALMKGSVTNVENRHLKGTLKQYDGEKVTCVIDIDLAPNEKPNEK